MKYLKYFENDVNYSSSNLTTLMGSYIPKSIYGDFICSLNDLTSLEFCPKIVDGDFKCSWNQITSLEFCPEKVGRNFSCRNNELTSLEHCPKNINGYFECRDNQLTSLEYCPEKIGGRFDCSYNQLTSLEFCPEYVGGDFHTYSNPWTNPIPYNIIVKLNTKKSYLYTDEQTLKFGSYEYQKEFLANTPEKYKDLEILGYNVKIKDEFDWLFNAADMGLM